MFTSMCSDGHLTVTPQLKYTNFKTVAASDIKYGLGEPVLRLYGFKVHTMNEGVLLLAKSILGWRPRSGWRGDGRGNQSPRTPDVRLGARGALRSPREGKGAEREEGGKEQKSKRGGKGCQPCWQKALPRVELGSRRETKYNTQ
eukprot:scaffold37335_cov58-Phaeocystis_antarctica.AAC.2